MKTLKIFSLILLIGLSSCSTDDSSPTPSVMDELVLTDTIDNATHQIELYTINGDFKEGYNQVWLRIKEQGTQQYLSDVEFSWKPMMNMTDRKHSGPHSGLKPNWAEESVYEGYLIFQMPGNDSEYWELLMEYEIDSTAESASGRIDVLPEEKKTINTFLGADDQKYILALAEPHNPEMGINEMKVALYKMADGMNFPVVNDYLIKLDPRMPGMDNHSSPNNVDLTQSSSDSLYYGELNLTMSGYWKINLILENSEGEVVKGEPVDESNPDSSLYLELEF